MNKLRVVDEQWAEEHVKRAERSVSKKIMQYKQQHRVSFLILMGVAIAIHLLLSATVVPFLLVFRSYFFDAVVLLIALIFGMLYAFMIGQVLHLERHHHLLALIVVPLFAIAHVVYLGNSYGDVKTVPIALLYGIVFVLPYVLQLRRRQLHLAASL
ncbi:MAG TPA: hypothetical protein VJK72_01495 [Candidatus Nanoarchaeia archaeon]|nr:hypothetical protein [Candidatus Nanoarchaeia archaeon]